MINVMINVPFYWWYIPVVLFCIPLVYSFLVSRHMIKGDIIIEMVLVLTCWSVCLGMYLMYFFTG